MVREIIFKLLYKFRHHYIEYLCLIVVERQIDPINILDTDDLEIILKRANIKRMPPRPYGIVSRFYRKELLKVYVYLDYKLY